MVNRKFLLKVARLERLQNSRFLNFFYKLTKMYFFICFSHFQHFIPWFEEYLQNHHQCSRNNILFLLSNIPNKMYQASKSSQKVPSNCCVSTQNPLKGVLNVNCWVFVTNFKGFWVLTQQLLGSFDDFSKPDTFCLECWKVKIKYCSVNTGDDFEICQFIF